MKPATKTLSRQETSPVCEALRIALPYLIFGCLWIFFSDWLLDLAPDQASMMLISNLKGWVYVFVTAALLWVLVYSRVKRLQAHEKELADSEARFRLLVECAPDAVLVQTDYRFAYVNTKMVELLGAKSADELIGRYIADFFAEEHRGLVTERIRSINEDKHALPMRELTLMRDDGARVDVEVSSVPVRFGDKDGGLVFLRDITERRRSETTRLKLEMQLRLKQRLESVGTLAGGIAHEINNPISGIINYAQLIEDSPLADEQTREYSREIIHESMRVAATVKNLLSFSERGQQTHTSQSVGSLISQTLELIEAVLRHDQIALTVSVDSTLPAIKCNAQQIRQVLMNLITNARDALNARYAGFDDNKILRIAAAAFERDGQSWVRITVEDHGAGIREELLPMIFDPFFTTNMRSERTGLGLSISHSIIKEHSGDIYFDTQPGEYTRAVVELPADSGGLK